MDRAFVLSVIRVKGYKGKATLPEVKAWLAELVVNPDNFDMGEGKTATTDEVWAKTASYKLTAPEPEAEAEAKAGDNELDDDKAAETARVKAAKELVQLKPDGRGTPVSTFQSATVAESGRMSAMRWCSTRESVRDGEPTVLAIVETLLAVFASVWFGIHFGTWNHVLVGAAIAPLTLLRTDEACVLAWRHGQELWNRLVESKSRWWLYVVAPAMVAGMVVITFGLMTASVWDGLILGIAITIVNAAVVTWTANGAGVLVVARLSGILVATWRAPLSSVGAIGRNWKRVTLAEDMITSPELIPLPTTTRWARPDVPWGPLADGWSASRVLATQRFRGFSFLKIGIVWSPMIDLLGDLVGFVLPAVLFRFSIKATALIWFPILWALKPPKTDSDPWPGYFRLYIRHDWVRFIVLLSCLTLVLLALKFLLFWAKVAIAIDAEAWKPYMNERLAEFITAFVRPGEVPLWHIASAVNSVLAITGFFVARAAVNRLDSSLSIEERSVARTLTWIIGIRRPLTCYVILCNFYAVWNLAQKAPLPPFGNKLFPWL